jgi:hypothetical protein
MLLTFGSNAGTSTFSSFFKTDRNFKAFVAPLEENQCSPASMLPCFKAAWKQKVVPEIKERDKFSDEDIYNLVRMTQK